MKLTDIYMPIHKELDRMQEELELLVSQFEKSDVKKIYDKFFQKKSKYLRSALLFLSKKAAGYPSTHNEERLIQLGLSLELLHNASLIHDDIIDESQLRRGQATINQLYGNKIAVLVGDILFTQALRLTSTLFEKEFSKIICDLSLEMCISEIQQANGITTRKEYFEVIQGKTARFMSVCCELGARYAQANEGEIKIFSDFGLNLGMVYQIRDDKIDCDPNAQKLLYEGDLEFYKAKGIESLEGLKDSIYKESLLNLMKYIANSSFCEANQ